MAGFRAVGDKDAAWRLADILAEPVDLAAMDGAIDHVARTAREVRRDSDARRLAFCQLCSGMS